MPFITAQHAQRLLMPPGGFSLLIERENSIAGIATIAPAGADTAEVGLLVSDRFQHQGLGTALLVNAARECANEGYGQLLMTVQPDNQSVVAVVSLAGLRARVTTRDGVTYIYASISGLRRPAPTSAAV